MQSAAVLPLLAFGAAAQDTPQQLDTLKKKMVEEGDGPDEHGGSGQGPARQGHAVFRRRDHGDQPGAGGWHSYPPRDEGRVYRDSEGRTRRETPDSVTISDPVGGSTYVINPKTNAVRKLQMSNTFVYRANAAGGAIAGHADGEVATFSLRTSGDGQANIEVNGKQLDPEGRSGNGRQSQGGRPRGDRARFDVVSDAPMAGTLATVTADRMTAGTMVAAPVMRKMILTGKANRSARKIWRA